MSSIRTPLVAVGALLVFLVGCTATPPPPTSTTVPTTSTTTTVATPGPYHITVRPLGAIDPGVLAAFEAAATRWERVITADVPTVTPDSSFTGCLGVAPTGTIDGLVIDVQVAAIDGVGGVLGSAGPCRIGPDGLPRAGEMSFDSADVANLMSDGRFVQVVLHEMAHVLGLGTAWPSTMLTGTGTSDPRFTGTNAVGEWHALGGTGDVPVEATGGAGTAGSHWRESSMGSELMTGWLNNGTNPLSRVTIASFADLGFHVDRSQADPYTLPSQLMAPLLRAGAAAADDGEVILVRPTGQL